MEREGHDSRDSSTAQAELYRELAKRLAAQGFELRRYRSPRELSSNTRGLSAVMGALAASAEPLSPGDLARKTGVTDARIANALRALEAKGLIARKPSVTDRRRVEVTLTERGRAFVHGHTEGVERFIADFLAELGEGDARDLVRVLDRVLDVLRERKERSDAAAPHAQAPFGHGTPWGQPWDHEPWDGRP